MGGSTTRSSQRLRKIYLVSVAAAPNRRAGVTCDDGATFDWEPVTADSGMHNMRPVVPKWDAVHTALVWLRGTYTTAQSYDQAVVGLIEEH